MCGQGEQGEQRQGDECRDNICASCKVSSHLNPGGGINYRPHLHRVHRQLVLGWCECCKHCMLDY